MSASEPRRFEQISTAVDFILQKWPQEIRAATPLGLGKPNQLLNELYQRVKQDPQRRLVLFTALSLTKPRPKSDLERRFLQPFLDRHFGPDYPDLRYELDLEQKKLPPHIEVHEFYFQAAQKLGNPNAQQKYVSLNYTHVARHIVESHVQVIFQLVAKGHGAFAGKYSLSCNPDLTLDVVDLYRRQKKELMIIGVVHPDLPFLPEDAIVDASFFGALVESPEVHHQLFALPQIPIDAEDHLIGMHASALVEDDGTLQIGIGSLSDALVSALLLRHENNEVYRQMIAELNDHRPSMHKKMQLSLGKFAQGLYGTSEMIMDGFMYLRKHGILKREVFELSEKKKRYLHGAFFLGTKRFYDWLSHLSMEDFQGLNMTRVSLVNDLYDSHELALRRQRKRARFFNTCMQVTLLGSVAADTLENGQVVSGVGGQYNFVAMAHELADARSVLLLRSTRTHQGKRTSNIVWGHEQLTIPRHLRDIVVTEYGIADLRGKTDAEVIQQLLNITDAEFQESLLQTAKHYGKISQDYKIPDWAKRNTPAHLREWLSRYQAQQYFAPYPFGSDFTEVEQRLLKALGGLKENSNSFYRLLELLGKGLIARAEPWKEELQRLQLQQPGSLRERFYRCLVLGALTTFQ